MIKNNIIMTAIFVLKSKDYIEKFIIFIVVK